MAIGTALAIGLTIASAGASVAGSYIASRAASSAGKAQAQAAKEATQITANASNNALAEQKRQFNIQQQNLQPYLNSGYNALGALNYGLGLGSNTVDLTQGADGSYGTGAITPSDPAAVTSLQSQIQALNDEIGGMGVLQPGFTDQQLKDYNYKKALASYRIQNLNKQLADQYGMTPDEYATYQKTLETQGTDAGTGEQVTDTGGTGLQYGSLMENFDPSTVELDPSFDLMLQKGQQAIERSGAAHGSGLGGGTLKALNDYTQDYTKTGYNDAYARQFNTFETNQANRYNRLASLAGVGQTTANQMNSSSANYADNAANIITNQGNTAADLATQAGNARASSIVGSANAWNSGLSSVSSNIMNAYLMNQMLNNGQTNLPTSYYGRG